MKTFKEWLVEMLKEPLSTIPVEKNPDIKRGGFNSIKIKQKRNDNRFDKRKKEIEMDGYYL